MKNFMNRVDTVLEESLDGFAAAHADIVVLGDDYEFIRRKQAKDRVIDVQLGKIILEAQGILGDNQ